MVASRPKVFLSSADGDVGELLELPQGCQRTFRGSGGKVGFLSRCHSGIVTQLALEENILVLLVLQQGSSLSRWDVEELLELPQGCQAPF